MISLPELIEVAKEAESQISFSWNEINISKDDAYRLLGITVQEMDEDPLTLKATILALLVENMVLHIEILKQAKEQ